MKSEFEVTQKHELDSWVCDDPAIRADKALREAIRYPLLKRQMGLDYLPTAGMEVWDIGCGPIGGVSTILEAKKVRRFDPLAADYAKYYPLNNYEAVKAEDLKERLAIPDLVIVTNAMDHFDNPAIFAQNIAQYMKPGSFFAHLHAIDNSHSHPHDAHAHDVNPEMFREHLSADFEQVWGLDYQKDGLVYGWRRQPAFSGLYRKVTGYK
jgi:2-polyprenyl-3-methyl-5-hydroxy-6-metoxy-1,4-benzoquinol methylase